MISYAGNHIYCKNISGMIVIENSTILTTCRTRLIADFRRSHGRLNAVR